MRVNELENEQRDFYTDIKTSEEQVSITDYFEEAASAAHELIVELCYAIIAISRAAATLLRLSARSATLVLAVACLIVAVGIWAYAAGKRLWSKIF